MQEYSYSSDKKLYLGMHQLRKSFSGESSIMINNFSSFFDNDFPVGFFVEINEVPNMGVEFFSYGFKKRDSASCSYLYRPYPFHGISSLCLGMDSLSVHYQHSIKNIKYFLGYNGCNGCLTITGDRDGDNVVKIEISDGEEVIKRKVTKFGRIEGLRKWVGSNVTLIRTKDNNTSEETKKHGKNDGGGII